MKYATQLLFLILLCVPQHSFGRTIERKHVHIVSGPLTVACIAAAAATGLWWRKSAKEAARVRSQRAEMIVRSYSGASAIPSTKLPKRLFLTASGLSLLSLIAWLSTRTSANQPLSQSEIDALKAELAKLKENAEKPYYATIGVQCDIRPKMVDQELQVGPECTSKEVQATVNMTHAATGMSEDDCPDAKPTGIDKGVGTDPMPTSPPSPKQPAFDITKATVASVGSVSIPPAAPKTPTPPPSPKPTPFNISTATVSLASSVGIEPVPPRTPTPSPPSSPTITPSPASSVRSVSSSMKAEIARIRHLSTEGDIMLPMTVEVAAQFLSGEFKTNTQGRKDQKGREFKGRDGKFHLLPSSVTYNGRTLEKLSQAWKGLKERSIKHSSVPRGGIITIGVGTERPSWTKVVVSLKPITGSYLYRLTTVNSSGEGREAIELSSTAAVSLRISKQNTTLGGSRDQRGREKAYAEMREAIAEIEEELNHGARASAQRNAQRAAKLSGGGSSKTRRRLHLSPQPTRSSSSSPQSSLGGKAQRAGVKGFVGVGSPSRPGMPPLSPSLRHVRKVALNLSSAATGGTPPKSGKK